MNSLGVIKKIGAWLFAKQEVTRPRFPRRAWNLEILENRIVPSGGDTSPQLGAMSGIPDGVRFLSSLVAVAQESTLATAEVSVTQAAGQLDAWIDFNGDGVIESSSERIADSLPAPIGRNLVTFTLPAGASSGSVRAVFQLSAADGGIADAEEYLVNLLDGNAPSGQQTTFQLLADTKHTVVVTPTSLEVRVGAAVLFSAPQAAISQLALLGTPQDESAEIDVPQAGSRTSPLDISFDGVAGHDTVQVVASEANDSATISPEEAHLTCDSYQVDVFRAADLLIDGAGGQNSAVFQGSADRDEFASTIDSASFRSVDLNGAETRFQQIQGFRAVTAITTDSNDSAILYDTPGDDVAVVSGADASLTNPGDAYSFTARGFATVSMRSTLGGYDQAFLHDAPRDEDLVFTPQYAILRDLTRRAGTHGQYAEVRSFDAASFVRDHASPDNDIAWVYGGAGVDLLTITGSQVQMRSHLEQLLPRPDGDAFVSGFSHFPQYQVAMQGVHSAVILGGSGALNLRTLKAPTISLFMQGFQNWNTIPTPRISRPADIFKALHDLVLLVDPTIAQATSPLDLAIRLRDHVYQDRRHGLLVSAWTTLNPYQRYVDAILYHHNPLICGGAMILYQDLLTAFGLKGRYVLLWAFDNINTHATNEVYIQGRWIVMDPTFNVSVRSKVDNHFMSWAEIQAGMSYVLDRNGKSAHQPLIAEDYPLSFQQLTKVIKYYYV
ncbi:MAG: transglutaminase domain-containing protein [Planctomycetes bacterium]|nr:transglutaminase domain-containing protein [Planctomycetota bacterium]